MNKPVAVVLLAVWLGIWNVSAHAAACPSVRSGNWNNCSTWSGLLCLLSCGGIIGGIPNSTTDVTISAGDTVTVNASGAAASTVVTNSTGTLQFNSGISLNVGNGVTNGGTTAVGAGTLNSASFTNNNVVTISSGLINVTGAYTNTTSGDTVTISDAVGRLTVGGTLTNGGTVTVGPGTVNSATFTNNNAVTVSSGLIDVADAYSNTGSGDTITISDAAGRLTVGGTLTNGGSIIFTGAGTVNANGAFASSGIVTNTAAGTINFKGDAAVNGTFDAGSGTVVFNGGSNQNVSGDALGFYNVTLDGAGGITLGNNLTASGTLTFTSGKISTGSNKVTVGTSGTVSGASSMTGYVAGCLEKLFPAGASSFTFVIGDASAYTPVAVSVSSTGDLTWCTATPDHPNIGSSLLAADFTVNRYWTASSTVVPGTYSATINFPFSEIDMGAAPANFQVQRYDASAWTTATVGTRTSTSTQATGLTAVGDFAIGELKPKVKNEFIYLRENY